MNEQIKIIRKQNKVLESMRNQSEFLDEQIDILTTRNQSKIKILKSRMTRKEKKDKIRKSGKRKKLYELKTISEDEIDELSEDTVEKMESVLKIEDDLIRQSIMRNIMFPG